MSERAPEREQPPSWQPALDRVERSLLEAGEAIAELRRSLEGQEAPDEASREPVDLRPVAREADDQADDAGVLSPAKDSARLAAFERVWERIEREKIEQSGEPADDEQSGLRGLDLLPKQYLITIEDRESKVDLAPLHRALLTLAKIDDISLVSFANGVPVISIRTEGELDFDKLRAAVAAAMDRACEVIPQDNGKLFLRLTSHEDKGG